MSYFHQKTGDSLLDYFERLADFYRISHHLLTCNNEDEFEVWFEQAELIDKRALYLFIKDNHSKIPESYLLKIKDRFDSSFKA